MTVKQNSANFLTNNNKRIIKQNTLKNLLFNQDFHPQQKQTIFENNFKGFDYNKLLNFISECKINKTYEFEVRFMSYLNKKTMISEDNYKKVFENLFFLGLNLSSW